jgi:hypothetical protein
MTGVVYVMHTNIIHDKRYGKGQTGASTADRGQPMTDQPKTLSVPEAGRRYFGLARNASYDAARRGELPVIRIGSRLRVPIIALERMLDAAGREPL